MRRRYALVVFALFFATLFVPLGVRGRLPGNCDTWLAIAIADTYAREAATWVTGEPVGRAMYPVADIHSYGEAAPAAVLVLLAARAVTTSDIAAYTLFMILLFTGTACGVFLLAEEATGSRSAGFLAGLSFAASTPMLANIDDPILLFWLLPALALTLGERFARTGSPRTIWAAAALGGLQVLFSVYVFAYQTVLLGLFALVRHRELVAARPRRHLAGAALLYLLLVAPTAVYYLSALDQDMVAPPLVAQRLTLAPFGLQESDWVHALPDNLLYPAETPDPSTFTFWVDWHKRAFLGFLLWGLALVGVRWAGRWRSFLVASLVAGALLAWRGAAPFGWRIEPVLTYVSAWIPVASFLRIGSRAFLLVALATCLLAAFSVAHLATLPVFASRRRELALVTVLLGVTLLENLPFPLRSFEAAAFAEASPATRALATEGSARHVVLHLPSVGEWRFGDFGAGLFSYNREFIYMIWQTQHRQHTVNGMNGYYPRSRVDVAKLVAGLPDSTALAGLSRLGVDRIVFHRDMVLSPSEDLLAALVRSPALTQSSDDGRSVVFALAPGAPP